MQPPEKHPDHVYGYLVLAVLLALLTAMWARHGPPSERALRVVGMGLQLAGIGTVAKNIRDTRAMLNPQPPGSGIISRVVRWVERRVRKPKIIQASAHSISVSALRGSTTVAGHAPTVTTSIDERVGALEAALSAFRSDVDQRLPALEEKLSAKASKLAADERQAREEAYASLDRQFRDALTGGLALSMFGVACLVIGTVLGTAPQETIDVVLWGLRLLRQV